MRPRTLHQAVTKYNIPKTEVAKLLRKYARVLKQEIVLGVAKEIAEFKDSSIHDVAGFVRSLKIRNDYSAMTLTITSSFPYFQRFIDGSAPYPMTWLTQEKGVGIVPLKGDNGEVIFRMAPLTTADAWIHPGIAKHDFLDRVFDRSRRRLLKDLKEWIRKYVLPQILS
jgi:hypothetical protein